MKFKSKITVPCVFTLLFVGSSNVCHARPHAHGVFERLRRYVHSPIASSNHTLTPTVTDSSNGKLLGLILMSSTYRLHGTVVQSPVSNDVPALYTSNRIPVANLGHANATIVAPLHLPSLQPTTKPLGLVLQNGHQTLHQKAYPVGQYHGAHHQHTIKASRSTSVDAVAGMCHSALADNDAFCGADFLLFPDLSATSTDTDVRVTGATHVARQVQTVSNHPNDGAYESWVVQGFANPATSSASAASSLPTSLCPGQNGTVFRSSSGITYETVCGTNYTDTTIHSSVANSFEDCIRECDIYNYNTHGVTCAAAIYAQASYYLANNCALHSGIAFPSVADGSLQGAVRYSVAQSAHLPVSGTVTALLSSLSSASSTGSRSSTPNSQTSTSPSASATVSSPGVTYGANDSVTAPQVSTTKLHGPSENRPTTQYIQYDPADGVNLANSLLRVGVNGDLSTGYDISPQTGVLEVNIYTQNALAPLRDTPHLSRDGGRGGYVNGQHLFLFCDTGSYSGTTIAQNGDFLDFVSSSVAVDVGMNALSGNPIHLQDGIGEWSDNVGRQRGFAPLTQGEQAYNIAMQGQGQRYAVWIESSIIPLDAETGLIYAPIVYDNVNVITRAAVFTYTGNTILTITAGGRGGPVAQRPVRKLFDQDEPEWGVAGGLRSWGPSGIGGTDGRVYLFGGVSGGVLMARVAADSIENRDAVSNATSMDISLLSKL